MAKEMVSEEGYNQESDMPDIAKKHIEHVAESHDKCQFLTFSVDKEVYGVDLLRIREIKGWTETTRLPNSPSFMKGVINLRGSVIPIFDLKGRFEIGETVATEKHVVIILAVGDRLMGILVDAVSDIIEVESDLIKQAPQMESKLDDKFVQGLISIEDKMVVVLDIDSLFDLKAMKIEVN
jgi:purine-binding chemotaxis protein CheW